MKITMANKMIKEMKKRCGEVLSDYTDSYAEEIYELDGEKSMAEEIIWIIAAHEKPNDKEYPRKVIERERKKAQKIIQERRERKKKRREKVESE